MAKKRKALTYDGLNPSEIAYIGSREEFVSAITGALEKVTQFKVGDYLIAFRPGHIHYKREQITNSYGAPKKFIVVYADKHGVPYMKELNKKGLPVGNLMSPLNFDNRQMATISRDIEFEIDPDYTDAIIMADEENYDASNVLKAKSSAFKEITEHNKSLKLKFNKPGELLMFLKSLKVGDVFHKSIKTHFTILTLDPIPTSHNGTRIIEYKTFGTAQDSNGKVFTIDDKTFAWHAVYTGRPRSYNELKDPK